MSDLFGVFPSADDIRVQIPSILVLKISNSVDSTVVIFPCNNRLKIQNFRLQSCKIGQIFGAKFQFLMKILENNGENEENF